MILLNQHTAAIKVSAGTAGWVWTLVDPADAAELESFTWLLQSTGYVYRRVWDYDTPEEAAMMADRFWDAVEARADLDQFRSRRQRLSAA